MKKRPITFEGKKILGQTGDDDALEYGGGVIFKKGDVSYWQFWDPPVRKNFEVWTAKIPSRVLNQYGVTRYELADAMEMEPEAVRSLSSARDAVDRQKVLAAIMQQNGRSSVCRDGPEDLTVWELVQRWHPVLGVEPDSVPQVDEDDYIISYYEDVVGCGQVHGNFLGAFESLECCASAIASDMERTGHHVNVFVINDDERLERLEWNRERWVDKPKVEVKGVFAPAIWRFRMRPWYRDSRKQIRKLSRIEQDRKRRDIRGSLSKLRL
jgi:hypothetical protein